MFRRLQEQDFAYPHNGAEEDDLQSLRAAQALLDRSGDLAQQKRQRR